MNSVLGKSVETKIGRSIAFLSFLLIPWASQAGLLIEPYIGYEQSQIAAVGTVNSISGDYSAKNSGVAMGARLGYTAPLLFWAALDYSMLPSGTARPDLIGSNYSTSRSDLYAVVGLNFPILLRLWVGYGLANSLTLKKSTGDETYSGGTNYKAGVAFKLIPLIQIYVEGFLHKSSNVNISSGSASVSNYMSGGYADGGAVVGLTLPLDL